MLMAVKRRSVQSYRFTPEKYANGIDGRRHEHLELLKNSFVISNGKATGGARVSTNKNANEHSGVHTKRGVDD